MKKRYLFFAAIALGTLTSTIGYTATAPDGAALYTTHCLSCHGPLASSDKAGATAGMIQNAIKNNFGGMSSLSTLALADVQAIAAALHVNGPSTASVPATAPSSGTTPGTPAPSPSPSSTQQPASQWDGATLYGTYCSSCHGPLSSSTQSGASESQIQDAISSNIGGMGYFSSLKSAQISAIATALAGASPTPASSSPTGGGTDGASLYNVKCSSCHGQLSSSSVLGVTASGIQSAINTNKGGMGKLSSLSPTNIEAIASVLASGASSSVGTMSEADDEGSGEGSGEGKGESKGEGRGEREGGDD